MGTISSRKRQDGTTGHTAQIRIKRDGKLVYTQSLTFDRKPAARSWMARREEELATPEGLEQAIALAESGGVTLGEAIDKYLKVTKREVGKTKAQVLGAIKRFDIADKACGTITSQDIVEFATQLSRSRKPKDDDLPVEDLTPQTVGNYISHLSAVFTLARPAWGYPLSRQAMDDAQIVLRDLGMIAKSEKRDRRPTLEELDKLMEHFASRNVLYPEAVLMPRVIAFAIFSTRRQDEITRIARADVDEAHSRVLIRDMKHPGQKKGNDVWCELVPEALAILKAMPAGPLPFPYTAEAISAAFTRACKVLGIEDLHFHDLRHEGVSRLFEMGRTVPQAASVSGHRSWQSLQRYTHLREAGDKFANWKWLPTVTRAIVTGS